MIVNGKLALWAGIEEIEAGGDNRQHTKDLTTERNKVHQAHCTQERANGLVPISLVMPNVSQLEPVQGHFLPEATPADRKSISRTDAPAI